MPSLKRGKVLIEDRWNIVLCRGLAAYLPPFGLGVGDARPHTLPYEGQFQLIEDGRHLKEGCAHHTKDLQVPEPAKGWFIFYCK